MPEDLHESDRRASCPVTGRPPTTHALLTHRHWPLSVAGVAMVLTLPSLWAGLLVDDCFIRVVVRQPENFPVKLPHPLDTYSLLGNDPEMISQSIAFGTLPWWYNPEVKGRFWRPLTSMTQYVDHRVWPDQVWLMHLQSVLWYGAVVLAAALTFRRFMGGTFAAGLAALLFAVEEAHGTPVGFLANRNSVIACLFGLLALLLHHRWRTEGSRAKGAAAVVMFAAALLSAEAGIGAMAYIAAYALVMESGPIRRRLLSLAPYAAVVIAWRCVWSGLGYGVSGLPLYVDPPREPWMFIQKLFIRLPQLVTGQFAVPPAEVQVVGMAVLAWTWLFSAAVAVFFLLLFWPTIRTDRTARFFGLGALFALVPVCATIAQTRSLMFVGIGAFGLLAIWLTNRPRRSAWPRAMKAVSVSLIMLHLIAAPVLLAVTSRYPVLPGADALALQGLPDMDGIEGCDLVILSHPMPITMIHYLGDCALSGDPMPAHTRTLTHGLTRITVTRVSQTELQVRAENGLPGLFSRLLNLVSKRLTVGAEVKTEGLTVRIVDTNPAGLPREAVFTFDRSIDDDSLKWLQWSGGSFKPFTPPVVGQSIDIPAPRLPSVFRRERQAN